MAEEGPFRMPRSAGRSEPHQAQPEEVEPEVHEEPKPVYHAPATRHHTPVHEKKKPSRPKFLLPGLVAVIVVIILIVGIWSIWLSPRDNTATVINQKEYQALFLTNGQVYFGKLDIVNSGYFKLTDVFYLQTSQSDTTTDSKNPQQANTDQNANVQLIKLGSDQIHDPEDAMVVGKDQVLFFENIKSNGKVAQSIQSYKNSHK